MRCLFVIIRFVFCSSSRASYLHLSFQQTIYARLCCWAVLDAILSVAYNPIEAKRDQFVTTGVDGVVKFWNFASAAGDNDARDVHVEVSNGDMVVI